MQNLDQSVDCFSPRMSVSIRVYHEYSLAGILVRIFVNCKPILSRFTFLHILDQYGLFVFLYITEAPLSKLMAVL